MKQGGRRSQVRMHPRLDDINRDLILKTGSHEAIAQRYGLSYDSIVRHWQGHVRDDEELKRWVLLDAQVDQHRHTAAVLNEDRLDIAKSYEALARRVEALITKAEGNDDSGLALAGMEGLRKVLRDVAQVQGKLAQTLRVEVSVLDSPEWVELRDILEQVFGEHPDARKRFLEVAGRRRLSIARKPDA